MNKKLFLQRAKPNNVEKINTKHTSMEIPVYRPKEDTIDNRVDRISKYIAALKSINLLTQGI